MRDVLITGGTGSFGQAMAKHLVTAEDGPTRVIVYSRGELAQAEMARDLRARDRHARLRFFIGDVRDRARLARALHGVDTVIHAAALKRIEVGQYNPTEMVKTNILGAMNLIEAAYDAGVRKIVALSTDKAWQPISPYGQSKALAETIFLNAYHPGAGPACVVCRYGNVWKSNGSVVPYWANLIKQGSKSVPVTDPDCTRFFMTMPQALELVLGAILYGKAGELVIPKLPAYRLGDLAEAMSVAMEIKGLPAWEKLHEGMNDGNTSNTAPRMTVKELQEALL